MRATPTLLVLMEHDYLYGTGQVILRVRHVEQGTPVHYSGEDWYPVHGVQLNTHGWELGDRSVLVRATRLSRKPVRGSTPRTAEAFPRAVTAHSPPPARRYGSGPATASDAEEGYGPGSAIALHRVPRPTFPLHPGG